MAARIRVLSSFLTILPCFYLLHALPTNPGTATNIKLIERPECQADITNLCSKFTLKTNNFAILDCLQSDPSLDKRISEPCQTLVWNYKFNLTKDDRFESAGSSVCKEMFMKFQDCQMLPANQGQRIPCLLEHIDNVTDANCNQFLVKMGKIIFSDYHMINKFAENCQGDIDKLQCGRLENDKMKIHNQGKTLYCLAEKVDKLVPECKQQVLRVAELQSDDYHMDRPLFFACRDAREQFCPRAHAGDGKVYKCLYKHKNEHGMPEECRKMLTVRQKLIHEDVKVEKTFFKACEKEMKLHGCLQKGSPSSGTALRSTVLLCLEDVIAKDKKVTGACMAEMTQMRKDIMEDYQITPEIVARCDIEINTLCGQGVKRGGVTLHCLLQHANPKNPVTGASAKISDQCKGALETLLQEANVGEDFTVDKVLAEACQPVLENECQNSGKSGVINCLMEKVQSEHMTDDCEDRLLEIQYFVVRDFRLDTELYKQCHKDAVKYCYAPENWYEGNKATADNSPMIFPCLYRHMKDEDIEMSRPCRQQIKRTMRKRAQRIDLEPEIEDKCLQDLGAFCSDMQRYGKGKDMQCLQDHYEELSEDCQEEVKEFTEDEDKDLDLDTLLMKACTPMIKKFCGELMEHNAAAADVMECLIEYKHHHEMNDQCAAGIIHHQVIQLKDFSFTYAFKEACKSDVKKYCADKIKKMDIVVCLSQLVRDDVLTNSEPRVNKTCRKQLRTEVMRRGESVELDVELQNACRDDIKGFCSGKHPGNAEIIQCLKFHGKTLSDSCHKVIFKRKQEEAALGADYELFRECKNMIKTHCNDRVGVDVVGCLRMVMDKDHLFDFKCKAVVMKRMLARTKDYRLNPSLAKNCERDIPKFCREIVQTPGNQDTELEGKVINCLKIQYIKKRLSSTCHSEIKLIMEDAHRDINMDPVLMKSCETQIKQYCRKELLKHEDDSHQLKFVPSDTGDEVEECLEQKMMEGKIDQMSPCGREISRIVEEAHVDVHIDPLLKTECLQDLSKWCAEIESGEGKKMSCLLSVLEVHPNQMKSSCRKMLVERRALWEYAAKSAPAESLSELGDQIMQSSAKTYLMGVLMTIVGVIFLVGMTCGRVTKRAKLHKDK